MAGIIYTAVDRGALITDSPAHVDGDAYSIDVKLQSHSEPIEIPRTQHVSMAGTVETVLTRVKKTINCSLIWPDSENADMDEFLFSIAGGETFSFDPYGTIAVPDSPADVVCTNGGSYAITRMTQHGSTPWRRVDLILRYAL